MAVFNNFIRLVQFVAIGLGIAAAFRSGPAALIVGLAAAWLFGLLKARQD
jgi:hypothetical protein